MDSSIVASMYGFSERQPDCTAIVYGDRSCTYKQLHDAIEGFAAHMRRVGVKSGDKVALWGYSSINWLVAYFGIVRAGGVAVLVNFSLRTQDVAQLIEISQ